MLTRLAQKAFWPGRLPFPLLHIDTTWKFRAMIEFRDRFCKENGLDLLVYTNQEAVAEGINPFDHGKPEVHDGAEDPGAPPGPSPARVRRGLRGAGAPGRGEVAREGAHLLLSRRGTASGTRKTSAPSSGIFYNAKIKKGRRSASSLSPTGPELDVWQYVWLEDIPIVPLYYAAPRPVVERDGTLVMVDDARMRLRPGETPREEWVRFRTLGCYPLTGAVRSRATTLPEIVGEMLASRVSERQGRLIDHDEDGSRWRPRSARGTFLFDGRSRDPRRRRRDALRKHDTRRISSASWR